MNTTAPRAEPSGQMAEPDDPTILSDEAPAGAVAPVPRSQPSPWLASVLTGASWALLALMLALAAAVVVVPLISGAKPYTVLTGSMEPNYPPGTLVVARETPTEDLTVGDVITFQLRSGEAQVATHRIVGVGADADGEPLFVTRGDANEIEDENPVRPVQVVGKLWYSVPYVGWVNNVINGAARAWIVPAAALGLMAYGAVMVGQAVRERRARDAGATRG